MTQDIWEKLYSEAKKVQKSRMISPFIEAGSVSSPCGTCREYMMQLDKDSGDIEILVDFKSRKAIQFKELIPDWWGNERFNNVNR